MAAPQDDTSRPATNLAITDQGKVVVRNFQEIAILFEKLLASKAVPKHINSPHRLFMAHQLLSGLNLNWIASLKDTWYNEKTDVMALCNDAPLAAVQQHPDYVTTVEYFVDEKMQRCTRDNFVNFEVAGALCIAKRVGTDDKEGFYTLKLAKQANLLHKNNWAGHPAAMLRMRARAIALRAQWADVLQGRPIREGDEGFDGPPQAAGRRVTRQQAAQQRAIALLGDERTDPEIIMPGPR